MLEGYHCLTLTHREAPLETIGQLVLRNDADRTPELVLQQLKTQFDWEEVFYLATCNRVLFFYYQAVPAKGVEPATLVALLRPDLPAQKQAETASYIRQINGGEAIQHLLEVASSMDSLVIGEREVIRQMREAFEQSRDWGLTGDHLRLLMRFTIETAKSVYSQTGIGEKALSVVALAFREMEKHGLHRDQRILLVGAGQTIALVAKFLDKSGFRNTAVFNRSLDKAEAVAEYLGGKAYPLEALASYQQGFDVMIVCTGAAIPIITTDLYQRLLANETGPKTVVDLAVPNNVAKSVVANFPMHYIQIEGLRDAARENLAYREKEREKAAVLIQDKIYEFRQRWHERQVERSMYPIAEAIKAVREKAVSEVFGKDFDQLDPAAQELVHRMLAYMEKKCVAIPMKAVKEIVLHASRERKMQPATDPAKP